MLVKPAGPHQCTNRSGSLNAAKTCSGVAEISRDVWKGAMVVGWIRFWVVRIARRLRAFSGCGQIRYAGSRFLLGGAFTCGVRVSDSGYTGIEYALDHSAKSGGAARQIGSEVAPDEAVCLAVVYGAVMETGGGKRAGELTAGIWGGG